VSRRAAAVEALAAEYAAATDRLNHLTTGLDEGRWQTRPPTGGWSTAECVEHLNITSATYLPVRRHLWQADLVRRSLAT
jgi:PPE-repeat protein